jgi:nicotinamidase/pyrazinamidase
MNTADNMGRAILRINMGAVFPGRPAHKPAKSVAIRGTYQHVSDGDRVNAVRALIIVDVQKDFCEGGVLPVSGGHAVARAINDYLAAEPGYDHVVATKDFHIDPGDHFSADPDYASSWPPHCRAGSFGADFDSNLDTARIEAVFRKGAYSSGYSGFEGVDGIGTSLLDWLRQRDVAEVDVVGLATDHCVRRTARDAARAGLTTRVLVNLTAGVSEDSTAQALTELSTASIALIGSGL